MPQPVPRRRSQVERSAATISRLLDATIDAIAERGYERATVREIAKRAGVSQGGLFRHFPTRRDLFLAAVERLHDRQLAAMTEAMTASDATAFVSELRIDTRSPVSVVWLELCVAARTDPDLLDGLRPLFTRHRDELRRLVTRHPEFAHLSEPSQWVWLDIVERVFRSDALAYEVEARPEHDVAISAALVDLLEVLRESDRSSLP
jgi:AcrR family transcriptional regulator